MDEKRARDTKEGLPATFSKKVRRSTRRVKVPSPPPATSKTIKKKRYVAKGRGFKTISLSRPSTTKKVKHLLPKPESVHRKRIVIEKEIMSEEEEEEQEGFSLEVLLKSGGLEGLNPADIQAVLERAQGQEGEPDAPLAEKFHEAMARAAERGGGWGGGGVPFGRGGRGPGPMAQGHLEAILEGLHSPDDGQKFSSLMELTEALSMAQEDQLGAFNMGEFLPCLVDLLQADHNPNLMLLACRALTHLMEVSPGCVPAVAGAGAVPMLCAKLLAIEYMDLAEQALTALNKICREHASVVLKEGGLMAVLQFLDFFPTGVQRSAVHTASLMCKRIRPQDIPLVDQAIPKLSELLNNNDERVVDYACKCFAGIVETYRRQPQALAILRDQSVLDRLSRFLVLDGSLAPDTYALVVRTLTRLCSSSAEMTLALLNTGVVSVLQSIIAGFGEHSVNDTMTSPGTPLSSQKSVRGILDLVGEMLPPVTQELPAGVRRILCGRVGGIPYSGYGGYDFGALLEGKKEKEKQPEPKDHPHVVMYREHPEMMDTMSACLLKGLVDAHGAAAVAPAVRQQCLGAVVRLIAHSTAESLKGSLDSIPISSFIAGLLGNKDMAEVATAVFLADALMVKLPEIFSDYFQREGVFHEMERNAAKYGGEVLPPPSSPSAKAPADQERELMFWIAEHATLFLSAYLPKQVEDQHSPLHALVKALHAHVDKEDDALPTLQALSALLMEQGHTGVSTFELHKAGVVSALLRFMTAPPRPLDRVAMVCHVFMGLPLPSTSIQGVTPKGDAWRSLVHRVQDVLSKVEEFPVLMEGTGLGLGRGFKLSFVQEGEDKELTAFRGDQHVGIDPLASFGSIEEYLWSVVHSKAPKEGQPIRRGRGRGHRLGARGRRQEEHHLVLSVGGMEIPFCLPIVQVVRVMHAMCDKSVGRVGVDGRLPPTAWKDPIEIKYRKGTRKELKALSGEMPKVEEEMPQRRDRLDHTLELVQFLRPTLNVVTLPSVLHHSCGEGLAEWDAVSLDKLGLHPGQGTHDAMVLLCILEALNRLYVALYPKSVLLQGPIVPSTEFASSRLTAKLACHLNDVLTVFSGGIPSWCHAIMKEWSFMMPFEVKTQYLRTTGFGSARSLNEMKVPGKLRRQKVRVHRSTILEAAREVMRLYGSGHDILDIEYYDEVGTGQGPTFEFYTIVSHELQRASLGLWRNTSNGPSEFVDASRGLWPRAMTEKELRSSAGISLLKMWEFVGTFLGKAMLDGRLVDLPLAGPMWKILSGKEDRLNVHDVSELNPALAKTVEGLRWVGKQHEAGHKNVMWNDCAVEDLDLNFVLPGYPEYELLPGGKDMDVTTENAEDWASLVTHHMLIASVWSQLCAMRRGMDKVFHSVRLSIFSPGELDLLACGTRELFTMEALMEHTKCDHGYSHSSHVVKWLFELLVDMPPDDQRKFLSFATGTPNLPVGGLCSIHPRLTIVRKDNAFPDQVLPTVSTCTNYVKLPHYSTKDILERKLRMAIHDGRGSFQLS